MLTLCGCGRHIRSDERVCPFCGAVPTCSRRGVGARASRAAIFAGAVAALGVACAARTGIGGANDEDASSDASSAHDGTASDAKLDGIAHGDAPADAISADAHDDHALADVIEECAPQGAPCITDSDCCDKFCGFHQICGQPVPPYGGSPPPEE
ncbi:MAG TPA: hypothetical protein VGH28_29240 [Polyangiaceae bacterium]